MSLLPREARLVLQHHLCSDLIESIEHYLRPMVYLLEHTGAVYSHTLGHEEVNHLGIVPFSLARKFLAFGVNNAGWVQADVCDRWRKKSWVFSVAEHAWKKRSRALCSGFLPGGFASLTDRTEYAVTEHNGTVYYFGGRDAAWRPAARLSARSEAWTDGSQDRLPDMMVALEACTAVACGDFIYVLGGQNSEPGRLSKHVQRYDIKRRAWAMIRSMIQRRARCAAITLPSGHIFVAGGGEQSQRPELFDPDTNCWTEYPGNMPDDILAITLCSPQSKPAQREIKTAIHT